MSITGIPATRVGGFIDSAGNVYTTRPNPAYSGQEYDTLVGGSEAYQSFWEFDTTQVPIDHVIDVVQFDLVDALLHAPSTYVQNQPTVADATLQIRLYDWGSTLEAADYRADPSTLPLLASYTVNPGKNEGEYTLNSEADIADNINWSGLTRVVVTLSASTDEEEIVGPYSTFGDVPSMYVEHHAIGGSAPPATASAAMPVPGVTTQDRPLAPTLDEQPNFDATADQAFTWTHNDLQGDPQAGFQLRIVEMPSGTIIHDTGDVTSTTSSYTLPGGTINNDLDLEWEVRTRDNTGSAFGSWSQRDAFKTGHVPTVVLNRPESVNAVATSVNYLVKWTFDPNNAILSVSAPATASADMRYPASVLGEIGGQVNVGATVATADAAMPVPDIYAHDPEYIVAVPSDTNATDPERWVYTSRDGDNWSWWLKDVSEDLYSVAYSKAQGKFVAVGQSGAITSSGNGDEWAVEQRGGNHLWDVVYAESLDLWVAVGTRTTEDTNNVRTSPDGSTWTQRSVGDTGFNGVTWSEDLGLLVATSVGGDVWTSPDGTNWTQRLDSTGQLYRVAWSKELGMFATVATGGRIFTSPDGISWTERGTPVTVTMWGIGWSHTLGQWVATGDDDATSGVILTSPDGISWTRQTSPVGTSKLLDVAWAGSVGLWIVGHEQGIITSPDGENWTDQNIARVFHGVTTIGLPMWHVDAQAVPATATADAPAPEVRSSGDKTIAATTASANASALVPLIEAGVGIRELVTAGGTTAGNAESMNTLDALSWSMDTPVGADRLYGVHFGDSKWMLVGGRSDGNGFVATSPNGVEWTEHTTGHTSNLWKVAYSPTIPLWVAIGANGSFITSTDGTSWTINQASRAWTIYEHITWGDGLFVKVGRESTNQDGTYSGRIWTSTDGTSWTVRYTTGTISPFWWVAYSGTAYVAVGAGGGIAKSSDGLSWGTFASGTSEQLRSVGWSPALSQWVAVGWNDTILTSPDGENWTAQTVGAATTQYFRSVHWSADLALWVAGGNSGEIFTSPDGESWTEQTNPATREIMGIA